MSDSSTHRVTIEPLRGADNFPVWKIKMGDILTDLNFDAHICQMETSRQEGFATIRLRVAYTLQVLPGVRCSTFKAKGPIGIVSDGAHGREPEDGVDELAGLLEPVLALLAPGRRTQVHLARRADYGAGGHQEAGGDRQSPEGRAVDRDRRRRGRWAGSRRRKRRECGRESGGCGRQRQSRVVDLPVEQIMDRSCRAVPWLLEVELELLSLIPNVTSASGVRCLGIEVRILAVLFDPASWHHAHNPAHHFWNQPQVFMSDSGDQSERVQQDQDGLRAIVASYLVNCSAPGNDSAIQ
ncbi:hypothetical protein GGX14DRAFT_394431 [Mycena pura]|uniref:Uncharacterized protein n=1 Tax=Mycena pura TaxID=153505 RepID=A0AAD6VM89_9AGAR|nr:hypothetical protein GGX14DRAFT_394431 [Mycena pura]